MPLFIPKQYNKNPTTIRIDDEKVYKIDTLAHSYDLSRSDFINQCIDFAIENISDMDNADVKEIDQLAKRYKMGRSAFINKCIEYASKNMPNPNE